MTWQTMTLLPTADLENSVNLGFGGIQVGFNIVPSTTPAMWQVLSDSLDATYITPTNPGVLSVANLDVGDSGLPDNATIQVALQLRSRNGGPQDNGTLVDPEGLLVPLSVLTTPGGAWGTTLSPYVQQASGAALTGTILDRLQVDLVTIGDMADLALLVNFNLRPQVSGIAVEPGSTRPLVTFNYTDPENDPLERIGYQVRRIDTGQIICSTPFVGLISAAPQFTIPVDLPTTVPLQLAVSASDQGSNGVYGDWSYLIFSVDVPAMAIPRVTPVWDPANGRVVLSVKGFDNMLDWNPSAFGDDAQSGLDAIVNATAVRITP